MRVLFLALHFAPDQVSGGYETTAIAEELAKLGHEVTMVAALPYHKHHRIEPPFAGRLWSRDTHNGVRLIRVWLALRGSKNDVRGRFLTYGTFNVASTLAALASGRHDVLVTPSPPLTNGLGAFLYSRLHRVPYVYNVRDIYPDVAVRLGLLTSRRSIAFFSWMERFVYRHAARVVVLTEGMAENLREKGFGPEKVVVIPHSVDTELIRPLPRDNAYARQYGLHDKFVAMYAGNMGMAQGLETALAAAALLRDAPDVRMVLVGDGAARERLEAQAQEQGLENVRFLPFVSRDEVALMHASADVGLSVLKRGVARHAMPAKLYSIMASGRAAVVTA